MKSIKTTKKFDKQLSKLSPKIKLKFKKRSLEFLVEPGNPQLNNHSLTGKYHGYFSINITGDLRALYYEEGDTIIIFAFIGSHSQLYK